MAVLVLVTTEGQLQDSWRVGLQGRGHEVLVASTATGADEHLRAGGVDLVVVDFDVLGGVKRLMTVLERLPEPTPFVLVSGAVDAPTQSARLGAAAFVPKPCTADDLALVVARLVGEPPPGEPRGGQSR